MRCEISEPFADAGVLGPERGAEAVQPCDGEMRLGNRGSCKSVRQDSRCVQLCPVKLYGLRRRQRLRKSGQTPHLLILCSLSLSPSLSPTLPPSLPPRLFLHAHSLVGFSHFPPLPKPHSGFPHTSVIRSVVSPATLSLGLGHLCSLAAERQVPVPAAICVICA